MFGNTKNKFLDLLLNKYKSICDSSGISFEYNIRTANLSFMDAPDLITLLSNILDNAVEAASVSEKKTIELSINRVNEFDMLSCVNSSDRKPQSVGKSLRTSKIPAAFTASEQRASRRWRENITASSIGHTARLTGSSRSISRSSIQIRRESW